MKIKPTIVAIVLCQVIALGSFAQKIVDSFRICNLPVRQGIVYKYGLDSVRKCIWRPDESVSIVTKCDSVFNFSEGKVAAIHNFSGDSIGDYSILIRGNDQIYICFNNLKYVSVKNGEMVSKGSWLGFMADGDDDARMKIDIFILRSGNKSNPVSFKEILEYFRCNAPSCEETGAYTL